MPIIDDTGHSPSITEGPRSLRLFTDRYQLIRAFTQTLHEDDALGKIFFFRGDGGNGKSLLIRFLQTYACKTSDRWEELRKQPDAEFVQSLIKEERSFDPLPVASLDFHAPPREFEQPMVDYNALLMLRRQLGAYSAEAFSRMHFPVYDFAALWYLHQTGRLTEERLHSLFPNDEINFVLAVVQAFKEIPGAGVATAALGLFNKHFKEWWTFFKARRRVDQGLLEEIQAMDPDRDLIPEMPHLFALDLNAALDADGAPPRIVLLFDGHDAFASAGDASAPESDRDRWLRYLLSVVDLEGGVVPVVTSRREPGWEDKADYPIPTDYLNSLLVGHFSDADAGVYLEKAGVEDPVLRARLCDYARVGPDEVHPLYAGLGADVVLQAALRGRRLTAEDFPEQTDTSEKRGQLVDRLLKEASKDVEYAVRSLAAAHAFDRDLFEKLGNWGRSRYFATDAAFDTLTQFSFVWEAEARGTGWYSIHALLRRLLRERADDRLRDADVALEEIYQERVQSGDALARVEVVYHAYQQESERGLKEWAKVFEDAINQRRFAVCEALSTVSVEFQPEKPWWRGLMAQEEGKYLVYRSRYAEADKALQTSIAAYDEALSRAPDETSAYGNKGIVLELRGDLLGRLSRNEEAEQAYADAVAVLDEVLSRDSDETSAYTNKGGVLTSRGDLLGRLSRNEEAEQAYADAVAVLDEALSRDSDFTYAIGNKGKALASRGDLLARLSRNEEAEEAYADAVTAYDELLRRDPDDVLAYRNKGSALSSRGDLLTTLSRNEEAEQAYANATIAYDELLRRAPDDTSAYNNKGIVLGLRGDLLARLSRNEEAEEAYADATIAYDELLRRAPDDVLAYNNKGNTLSSRGDLLTTLSRNEEAEQAYADAVQTYDEVLSRITDYIVGIAYNNKGKALASRGDLLARLSRNEEAEEAYADAVTAYDEVLGRAPDDVLARRNKGEALTSRGGLLARFFRNEEAEQAYADAVQTYDEVLSRTPDSIEAHVKKALALLEWGLFMREFVQDEVTRRRWEAAQAHVERILALASQREQAEQLLATIHVLLDDLDAEPSHSD